MPESNPEPEPESESEREQLTGPDPDPPSRRRLSLGGLRVRIAATAIALALAALSAALRASASFDEDAVPIGDVVSLDGIVSGTVHLTGGRLVIFSGDRFQSNKSSLAVNFSAGGSLILCPHSQLQILAASPHAGVMFAFQEGGSEQPFALHASDVVMTPDWRIQMAGNVPSDEFGTLQLSTSRRGELCLSASAKSGQFFRVSELAGDSVFDVTGQSSIRIADERIDNAPGGCSCTEKEGISAPAFQPSATLPLSKSSTAPPSGSPTASMPPATTGPAAPQAQAAPEAAPAAPRNRKQRPQDVAGYVRSFLHLLFGR
jgi:hypothetical protein